MRRLRIVDSREKRQPYPRHPASLVAQDGDAPPPATADQKLEAALLIHGRALALSEICDVFRWTRDKALHVLGDLETRLAPTGALLQQTNGRTFIRGRDTLLTRDERQRLAGSRRLRSEITLGEARMLRRVMGGQLPRARRDIGGAARAALGALIANSLIEERDGAYSLTPQVAFSLGLRSRPVRTGLRPARAVQSAPARRQGGG